MNSRSQSRAKKTQTTRNFDKDHTARKKPISNDESKEITIPRGDGPFPKKRVQKADSPAASPKASPVKEPKQPAEEPKLEKTQEMIDTYNRLKQEIEEKQKKVRSLTKQRDRLLAKAKIESQEYKYEPEEVEEEEDLVDLTDDVPFEEEEEEEAELDEEETKTEDAADQPTEDNEEDINLSDLDDDAILKTLEALEEEEENLD